MSAHPAIRVEHVAKQYRLGENAGSMFRYGSLRDTIAGAFAKGLGRRARPDPRHIWALQDISFEVPHGQVIGLIGRNGAGKSTLLKILSRITRPTRGMAELTGRVGSLLEVGTGFHPELTGRENMFLNGAILGMGRREIRRRFDAIVEFAGIAGFLDTPVKRYSSGMYVRLAFAVAAHLEPDILLVDEVLAVGDAEFQKRCLGKMRSVVRDGRTVLFVSHNMAAIKALCQRALLLDGGHLACDGHVDAVVDRYLSSGVVAVGDGVVPDEMPRIGSGEARIRRVELQDRQGHAVSELYFGQPFRIALTIETTRPVAHALFGIGISALDGTCVASAFSTDQGRSEVPLAPGWHHVAVDVDVTLLPRMYTIDCTIVRGDGYDIDSLARVRDFSVANVAQAGSDTYRWPTVRGFVRPATRWYAEPIGRTGSQVKQAAEKRSLK